MRLLIACPGCKRQFDVSGWPIGTRFRCHCGAVVTILQPQGHDAAVVRCSSCGAPRVGGAAACEHCGSDFTVHEKDLDTVCPMCLARLSDRTRFCHYCGVALGAERLTGKTTEQPCPACKPVALLTQRRVGETALLECRRCAGFWVDVDVLGHLIDKASQKALGKDWMIEEALRGGAAAIEEAQEGAFYRKCPCCGKMMLRRNYGGRSGVIVDVCREHGAWFDANELTRVLEWVGSGGLAKARKTDVDDAEHQRRLNEIAQTFERQRERMRGGHNSPLSPARGVGNILDILVDLGSIFGR